MSHNTLNYAERMRARGYRVTPQIRGAIKSVPGVVEVQLDL